MRTAPARVKINSTQAAVATSCALYTTNFLGRCRPHLQSPTSDITHKFIQPFFLICWVIYTPSQQLRLSQQMRRPPAGGDTPKAPIEKLEEEQSIGCWKYVSMTSALWVRVGGVPVAKDPGDLGEIETAPGGREHRCGEHGRWHLPRCRKICSAKSGERAGASWKMSWISMLASSSGEEG